MVNMQMLMKQQKGPSKDMTIDFDQSTKEIESAGTEMIPEFGSGGGTTITTIMVAETILGIVLVVKRWCWNRAVNSGVVVAAVLLLYLLSGQKGKGEEESSRPLFCSSCAAVVLSEEEEEEDDLY